MPKNLNISIPEPCHEKWDAMTTTEQGRHCGSCNKVVVDFTTMTDAQLVEYFQASRGKTCGRFRTDQVDRKIRLNPAKKPLLPFKYIAASLLATGALTQTAHAKDLADTTRVSPITQTQICADDSVKTEVTAVDSCESAEADTTIMIGDTVTDSPFALTLDTFITISGGIEMTMGFCAMPQESSNEVDSPATGFLKFHPFRIPYVGQILERRRSTPTSKPVDEKPTKKAFNFSLATLVKRLRLITTPKEEKK